MIFILIVIPDPFDRRVTAHVAVAVANAAMETGVSQKNIDVAEIKKRLLALVEEKQNVLYKTSRNINLI